MRRRLSDVLASSERGSIDQAWEETAAAADMGPLPAGRYVAKAMSGELFNSRQGTAGYKLALVVAEPPQFAGRRIWCDLWLTPAALPNTKRDFSKIGITTLEELERPLPDGLVVTVKVALRRDDNENEVNKVNLIDLLRVDPAPNPFHPVAPDLDGGASDEARPTRDGVLF